MKTVALLFGFEGHLYPPGKAEPKHALKWVSERVMGLGKGDMVMVYFSGHGFKGRNGLALAFPQAEYHEAVAYNFGCLVFEQLRGRLRGLYDRLFVIDACRVDPEGGQGVRVEKGREPQV